MKAKLQQQLPGRTTDELVAVTEERTEQFDALMDGANETSVRIQKLLDRSTLMDLVRLLEKNKDKLAERSYKALRQNLKALEEEMGHGATVAPELIQEFQRNLRSIVAGGE